MDNKSRLMAIYDMLPYKKQLTVLQSAEGHLSDVKQESEHWLKTYHKTKNYGYLDRASESRVWLSEYQEKDPSGIYDDKQKLEASYDILPSAQREKLCAEAESLCREEAQKALDTIREYDCSFGARADLRKEASKAHTYLNEYTALYK